MRTLTAIFVVTILGSSPALAYPFFSARPVPGAIAGPTDPHVAATFYNPAALGPLRGLHFFANGGTRAQLGSIERRNADGSAPGSAAILSADFESFMGLAWDLGTDAFTLGISINTPQTDLTRFAADSPVRYHAQSQTMITLQETIAAAVRLSSRIYVGASANFAQGWLRYRFSRDAALGGGSALVNMPSDLCGGAPCGVENPLAEQILGVRGFGWGIGFGVGILVRPIDRLWIGLSYTSRIFNTGRGADFPIAEERFAEVIAAPGQGAICPDINGSGQKCTGNSVVNVSLPDYLQLGVRIEIKPRFELESNFRWIHYGIRDRLNVSLQGGNFNLVGSQDARLGIPGQFALNRGFQDAWLVGVSARWMVGNNWRLSPSLAFETSAMENRSVNAAAIDAPKFDAAFTFEWKPIPHLVLGGHLGGVAYILSQAGDGFSPQAQVACVDSRYSLASCEPVFRGDGLPEARGNYTKFTLHASLAVGFEY